MQLKIYKGGRKNRIPGVSVSCLGVLHWNGLVWCFVFKQQKKKRCLKLLLQINLQIPLVVTIH